MAESERSRTLRAKVAPLPLSIPSPRRCATTTLLPRRAKVEMGFTAAQLTGFGVRIQPGRDPAQRAQTDEALIEHARPDADPVGRGLEQPGHLLWWFLGREFWQARRRTAGLSCPMTA